VITLYRLLEKAEGDRDSLCANQFEETISELFTSYAPPDLIPKTSILSSVEELTLNETKCLSFNPVNNPQVSIIIPAWNHWQYTYRCFQSLLENTDEVDYEVIFVDNGSSDETPEMLRKVNNIRIIRNNSNLGFLLACNEGARNAQGSHLLFLNNDAVVTKGWLKAMVSLMDSDDKIGAVGAKLIYPDGRLQEAGGVIFSDGRGWNIGNGDDPEKEIYNKTCEVDYCSGACLLVRKSLFNVLSGFDERYSPGYYEEVDLCFALRRMGYRVIYNPEAVVIHYESVTAGREASSPLRRNIEINRKKFMEKWENELSFQDEHPSITGEYPATSSRERLIESSTLENKRRVLKNVYKILDNLTEERDSLKKAYLASEADRAARLEVIERQGKEFSEMIMALKSSLSWRITVPFRWILDKWNTIGGRCSRKGPAEFADQKVSDYVYQPERRDGDFENSVELLRKKRHVVNGVVDHRAPQVVEAVHKDFGKRGIPVNEWHVNLEEYKEYFEKAAYKSLYPNYYKDFLLEKSFEHFVAFRLLGIRPDEIFLDIGSENSPVCEIYSRLTGCRTYRQDIMYPLGINGDQIGGDACEMPVPNEFAHKVALTCSLEHFEGERDRRLFLELSRVLKKGGRVCVIPLYIYTSPANQIDPTVSIPNNVPLDKGATIFCAKGWGNRFARFYSPVSFVDRIFNPTKDFFSFEVFRIMNADEVHHDIYAHFALVATRNQEKAKKL